MRKTGILLLLTFYLLTCFNAFPVYADSSTPILPDIQAESYILINAADNRVICEKDADKKQYPASTTKVFTAILALEAGYYEQTATVSQTAVDNIGINGSNMALKAGEVLQYKDLLRMALISSANDAANALAEGVGGSIGNFVALMNEKAQELGLTNTHMTNPVGLDVEDGHPEHQTSARDLAQIMRYATSNQLFREIIGETEYTLPVTNLHPEIRGTRRSTDLLLTKLQNQTDLFTVLGGKTGYTKAAQNVFVACARNAYGVELIVALMKHPSRQGLFEDAYKLFEYGFERVSQDGSLGARDFYDVRYRESADVIQQFYEDGYIPWSEDGCFDYAGHATREDFLQVLDRIRGTAAATGGNGSGQSHLAMAVDQGLLDESWRGTGSAPATRGDAITIMSRHIACRLNVLEMLGMMLKIKDFNTIPEPSRMDVLKACKAGIVSVKDDGSIGFDEDISREEMVLMLDRYIQYRDNALSTVTSLLGNMPIIRTALQSFYGPAGFPVSDTGN